MVQAGRHLRHSGLSEPRVTKHRVGPESFCFREFDTGRWPPEKTKWRFGFEHVRLNPLMLLPVAFQRMFPWFCILIAPVSSSYLTT